MDINAVGHVLTLCHLAILDMEYLNLWKFQVYISYNVLWKKISNFT